MAAADRLLSAVILTTISLCAPPTNAQVANHTASTTEGGIKLAGFHIAQFEMYFAVLLSLLLITMFKMYFPMIPYVPAYVPQSLVLILLGTIFGGIFNALQLKRLDQTIWKLTPNMFFHYLLPPIVLEAAYSLYNRTFLEYLGSILIYAVLGTVLNFLIIGPLMYGLDVSGAFGNQTIHVSLNGYFLFASLIVAVDPVAVLAIFNDISVEPGLYYMVFGESLLNDAVTVVLYRIMSEFVNVTEVSGVEITLGILSFFTISLGGLIVGVLFGLATSFVTRWTHHFGAVFILLMSYFAYIMGDCLGWSGIIAIIGCGLVQADYAFHNIPAQSLTMVREVTKETSEISESFIFFLIGVQLFSTEINWSTGFCLWGLVACLVARTIVVFSLTYLINFINLNKFRVTFKQQIILIYGGLRGAVAFSLGILVDDSDLGNDGKDERKVVVTATLFIIFFTVGAMGLTMKPLVKFFKIKLAPDDQLSLWDDLNTNMMDQTLAGLEGIIGSNGRNCIREFFIRLDDRYIRRWLQRDPETHGERIIRTYEKIALKLHYATIRPSQSSTFLQGLPALVKQKHLRLSGDSTQQLCSLVARPSDAQMQDFFGVRESPSYAAGLDRESSAVVAFSVDTKSNDGAEPYGNPLWRPRVNSGIEKTRNMDDFRDLFLKNIKSKEKVLKYFRPRQRNNQEMKFVPKTVRSQSLMQPVTNEERSRPPKDYPMVCSPNKQDVTADVPTFQLGDDDDDDY